jgi:hypothetical protein
MEKLTAFGRKDLDPKTVFIFVAPNASVSAEAAKTVCIWVGGEYDCSKGVDTIDWQQVAGDFLNQKGFSNTLPVKVSAYYAHLYFVHSDLLVNLYI